MRSAGTFISGLGVHVPPTVSVADAVERGLYPADEAKSGELRGVAVAGDVPAPELALRAARQAFDRCGRRPSEIDLLLYVDAWHQGPDGWLPHHHLQHHLVGGNPLAAELRQGCNGMFSAFELAARYLPTGEHRCALLVAADNFGTPLVDRWRSGPGFILGDGASSLVLTRTPGFAELLAVRSVTMPELEGLHRMGAPDFPPTATLGKPMEMAARAAEFKKQAAGRADLMGVWLNLYTRMLETIEPTLDEAGVTMADVRRVAFPNSGRQVVEHRWMAALDLPLSASTWEFGSGVGHISASDQVIALDHLLTTGELGAGDHMLLVGIGPGVTLSSAVVKIHHQPSWL
jgi:3-oxoacyl-[acyl-carrier-protein] synthase-3/clorobiocin biosynthesis protein CloN2